jgi:hypothetical protein
VCPVCQVARSVSVGPVCLVDVSVLCWPTCQVDGSNMSGRDPHDTCLHVTPSNNNRLTYRAYVSTNKFSNLNDHIDMTCGKIAYMSIQSSLYMINFNMRKS